MPFALIALAAAGVLATATVALLLALRGRLPHALPSERSLHDRPIPRVGGLSIWAGAVPVALADPPAFSGNGVVWLGAWAAVAAVSLADDRAHVAVPLRLGVHLAAALALAIAIVPASPGAASALAVVAAALAIAWGMNLYNFMDGSDGLAATMTLAGFGAYAAAFALRGEPWVACAAVAVGAAAFLAVNRPPASMFLGDVGAVPLGLLASAAGVDGVLRGAWPWWFPLLAFLPFALDATVTLARRAIRRERLARAHRSHYYQRLLQLGLGHGGTLAVYGSLMAGGAACAVACLALAPAAGPWALAAFGVVHAMLFATIDYHWAKRTGTR